MAFSCVGRRLSCRVVTAILVSWSSWSVTAHAAPPTSVTTFHSASLYWTPDSGARESRAVLVRFREVGASAWRDGFPLIYNPVEDDDGERVDGGDYRGSLVQLEPGTDYEVELSLEGTSAVETLRFTTWDEAFPEGEVVRPEPGGRITITESGTREAYRVYDGGGQVFDARDNFPTNIDVRADYIILRNFELRGASEHGVEIQRGFHDIVIENCDISGWGELEPGSPDVGRSGQAGVFAGRGTERIIIQRNTIHHPRYDSNTWDEEHCRGSDCRTHPFGPAAIQLTNTLGNNVIRYNDVYSEVDHYFADIFGGGGGGSGGFEGFPGRDSDIYGNYVANGWDDAMEIEQGGQNVRVWNNFIERSFMMIANAPVRLGPLYVFRNVIGVSERSPGSPGNSFFKMGTANPNNTATRGREWMTGYTYVFHNTLSNPDGRGPYGLGSSSRPMIRVVSRNNILFVGDAASHSIGESQYHQDVDFDFDLYNEAVPDDSELSGIGGAPSFEVGAFDRATRSADYRLSTASLGVDRGEVLPNFSDGFVGAGPDMGAHEGAGPVIYGRLANEAVPMGCDDGMCGPACDQACAPMPTACAGSPVELSRVALVVDGAAEEVVASAPIVLAAGEARATVTLSWGSEALFLQARVVDPDLRAHVARGETGDVWRDDAIEIFVDPDRSRDAFSESDFQLIVNARGAVFSVPDLEVEVATQLTGTLNDDLDDDGYVIEVAIPWTQLGLSPAEGLSMGVDVALDDRGRPDDGTVRGGVNATADWAELSSYRDPSQWCEITLVAQSNPPGDSGMSELDAGPGDADAGADASDPEAGPAGGCSCRAASARPAGAGWALLLLCGLFVRRRPRRATRRRVD